MRKQLALFFVIFLLNFSAPLVRAQGLDGTLRGEVKDQRGTVVVGAKVTVTTEQTDLSRTQVSSSGGFNFSNLQLRSQPNQVAVNTRELYDERCAKRCNSRRNTFGQVKWKNVGQVVATS